MKYICLIAALDSVEEAGGVNPDDFSVFDLNEHLQRAAVAGYSPLFSQESETHLSDTDI